MSEYSLISSHIADKYIDVCVCAICVCICAIRQLVIEPSSDKDFVVFLLHIVIFTVFRFQRNLFKNSNKKYAILAYVKPPDQN